MLNGTVTSVFGNDINTDDIIPALYLTKSDDPSISRPMRSQNSTPTSATAPCGVKPTSSWRGRISPAAPAGSKQCTPSSSTGRSA